MLGKLKQTAKQTIIYSLGNISSKLIGFILLPLYTEYLITEEYGMFAILEVTGTIMVAVFSFKLSTAMMRWCSVENSQHKIKSIIFTTYITAFLTILFLNLFFQPFTSSFSSLFFGSDLFAEYFLILFLSISFEILNLFSFDLLRLKEKPFRFICVSIIRLVVILSFNIYFIRYQTLGVKGILLSSLIGNSLVSLITLPFLIKHMVWNFLTKELKNMFKYGIPLIFSTISMMLLTMGDRYIIKYYLDYSEVGIYSLGYKIAGVINMLVIQSFQTGFLPIAYKNFDKPDAQSFFSKTLTYYALILVIVSLGLSLFSQEVIELFSKDQSYLIAYTVVPFISLAFIFKGIQYVYSLGLHFVKKTKYNAYIVFSAAILNVGLNFLLIPHFKIYGAAVATIITWIAMSTAFYKVSYKFYKVKYEFMRIGLMVAVGIILYCISLFFTEMNLYARAGLKIVLVVLFPISLFALRFFNKKEIQGLKAFWVKWKRPVNRKSNLKKR